ncbi:hypothetical protein KKE45_01525 [Patescibacteria group bacterium]|nr:hypothetical protein [Patescibacteria group bacterium]
MSLTDTAHTTRKLLKFGGLGIILFSFFWSFLVTGIKAYRKANPPKLYPTTRFGKLPAITFPSKKIQKKDFILELANDEFPEFPDQAKVYVVYRPTSTLLALEEDTKTARNLGFVSQPIKISNGIYRFENNTLGKTLTMNVLDGSFKLEYPYRSDQTLQGSGKLPSISQAIGSAKSFLQTADKLHPDLEEGQQKTTYWKITFTGLKSVLSHSEANAIRVDFLREDLDEDMMIYSSQPDKSSVSILISNSTVENKKIIEVDYKYSPIDRQSFSTYPIKSVTQAWNEMKEGSYWPAKQDYSNSVSIRNAKLAYFEPSSLTNYMQPIYVFTGDNGFIAYVSAISQSWISE